MGNKKIKFLSSYILWFSISAVSSSLLTSSCLSNNKQDIKNINQTLLNRPLKSLDSYTSKEAFINVFDEELFDKLFR